MTRALDADPQPDDAQPDDAEQQREPEVGIDRLRLLVAGGFGTVIVSYALLVPAAAAVVLTAGGGMSLDGAFAAAIPLWLAAHRIPLSLGGQPLGVLPLLPTLVIGVVIAVGAALTMRRLAGGLRSEAGAVLASTTAAHSAVAVLGSALLPRSTEVAAAPWAALVASGLFAGVSAATGIVWACGLPRAWTDRLPAWAPAASRGAVAAVAGLLTVGLLVLLLALVVGAGDVAAAYRSLAPTAGAGLGVTLLALAYLPNAAIGALSWSAGPGVLIGTSSASPFGVVAGTPGTFPLLAVVPSDPTPFWAPVALLAPVVVGVLLGRQARRSGPDGPWVALAAGVLATLVLGVLALLAGGRLAAGPYDPVRVPAELLIPALLGLLTGPAVLVSMLTGPLLGGLRGGRREDPYEYEDDLADDPGRDPGDDLADGYVPIDPVDGAEPRGSRKRAGRTKGAAPAAATGRDAPDERDSAADPAAEGRDEGRADDHPADDGPGGDRDAGSVESAVRPRPAVRRRSDRPGSPSRRPVRRREEPRRPEPEPGPDATSPSAEPSSAEPSSAEPSSAEPSSAEPSSAEPSAAESSAAESSSSEPEEPRPRTVGVLVALRARQAEEAQQQSEAPGGV